jgi:hypothetical protein
MKHKLKTRKMKDKKKNKYKMSIKNKNRKNRYTKNKKGKPKSVKNKHRTVRKRIMRGGGDMTFAIDENRFDIKLRTDETSRPGGSDIMRSYFLIVNDTFTNKQYILDIDDNNVIYLFLFENDKFYVYYINKEQQPNQLLNKEVINRQMTILNDDTLDLDDKMDELLDIGLNFSINLEAGDNEIKQEYDVNIENANLKLNKLNRDLQMKCPNLELRLNYLIQQPGIVSTFYRENLLTLCLYNQGNCISSIMCKLVNYPYYDVDDDDPNYNKPIPNSFDIASETNPSMQNRKFNKLLRAVLIIIGNLVTVNGIHIENILSEAINPISAWLLIRYYNGKILSEQFKNFIKNKENTEDIKIEITQELLEEYMDAKHKKHIEILVELNEENIKKANDEFNDATIGDNIKKLIKCSDIEDTWMNRFEIN